jgi:long-chain fatty acid transport protein
LKHILTALGALALTTTAAQAGGIDRSGQGIGALFEKGDYMELSFGYVSPSVSGHDVPAFGGGASGDVAASYLQLGMSVKTDLSEKLSAAVIMDQPFGADVLYGSTSVALGGTSAVAQSTALTALLRYKLDNGVSFHGGLRMQKSSAHVDLRGLAYGGLNGYSVDMKQDTGTGYAVGVAYEKPEIALRVALTYNSAITHEFATVETVRGSTVAATPTEVNTPQSINLDFQSGVAKNTLVFGSIRWVDWSKFLLEPAFFTPRAGGGLISLDDTITYSLGVGRKFNDHWSGALSVSYENAGDPLVSPLAPTNGRLGVTIAGIYTKDNMKITTGINFTKLGDAMPETGTPDVARANFSGNTAIGIGIKIGYTF